MYHIITLSDELEEKVQALAHAQGLSVSDYLTQLITQALLALDFPIVNQPQQNAINVDHD